MNYIIVDLEATCTEEKVPFQNETIEIGAVLAQKDNDDIPREKDRFSVFVRPVLNPKLTDFCTRLTSITQGDVDGAGGFASGVMQFLYFVGKEPYMFLSWGDYDRKQLLRDCALHQLNPSWVKNHVNLKQEFMALYGLERCGLGKALRILGIPFEGRQHRGVDDAVNIAKIFGIIFPRINHNGRFD